MADSTVSRRGFIKTSAAGAAAATATGLVSTPESARAKGANERLRIGIIGPGRRGFGTHVKTLVKLREMGRAIDIGAVNDVYAVHRDRAVDYVKSKTGVTPDTFSDYRELLNEKDIDFRRRKIGWRRSSATGPQSSDKVNWTTMREFSWQYSRRCSRKWILIVSSPARESR